MDSATEMLALFNQYTGTSPSVSSNGDSTTTIAKSARRTTTTNNTNTLNYSSGSGKDCIRTYHELVQLGIVYDSFTRDDRLRCQEAICRTLRSSERAIYTGAVTRRPVRDSIRALCYGAQLNVDMVRENVLAYLEHLDMLGLNITNITDKLLIKFIDVWYPYAASLDTCAWQHIGITSDDVQKMLKENVPLRGIACRSCISALLRLSRSGINSELGRAGISTTADLPVVVKQDGGGGDTTAVPTVISKSRKRKTAVPSPPTTETKRLKSSNGEVAATTKAKRTKQENVAKPSLPDLSSTESFVITQLAAASNIDNSAAAAVDPRISKLTLPIARKTLRKDDEVAMDYSDDGFDDDDDDDDETDEDNDRVEKN